VAEDGAGKTHGEGWGSLNEQEILIVSRARSCYRRAPVIWSTGIEAGCPPEVAAECRARRGRPDLPVGTLIQNADLNRHLVRLTACRRDPQTRCPLDRGVVSSIYEGELVTETRLAPKVPAASGRDHSARNEGPAQ